MAKKAERLLPSLEAYPPSEWVCVYHPDVQLTPEEWEELWDYERVESDALADPGVVGFIRRKTVIIPLQPAETNVGAAEPKEKMKVVAPMWRSRSGGVV